jgi:hypothetical protein
VPKIIKSDQQEMEDYDVDCMESLLKVRQYLFWTRYGHMTFKTEMEKLFTPWLWTSVALTHYVFPLSYEILIRLYNFSLIIV